MASICIGVLGCGQAGEEKKKPMASTLPQILESGKIIHFLGSEATAYFKTENISPASIQSEFNAPARVVAKVVKSVENQQQNLVLFDNPDLTANYRAFIQRLININQYNVNLARAQDLADHGAATGKEVIEARTLLANEKAAIIEDEAKLKLAGFNPEELIKAAANKVWVICDIPENQINKIKKKSSCSVVFTSFPDEVFSGLIEDMGDVVDNVTRMIKLRIAIPNSTSQLKAGMFATVHFIIPETNLISVAKESLVTVQGKNYVFVKNGPTNFERREVISGQQINNRIVIFTGVTKGDEVVTVCTMQLKGLSFGY